MHEKIEEDLEGQVPINVPHGGTFELLEAISPCLNNYVGPSIARVKLTF